jgi:ribonuclease Y
MDNLVLLLALLVGIPGGIVTGYYARKKLAIKESSAAEAKAQAIINEAKVKQKQLLVEAQEKSIQVIEQAKSEEMTRRKELKTLQSRLEKRETLFDQKLLDLENRSQRLAEKADQINALKQEILSIKEQQRQRLEQIAGLSRDQAKQLLLEKTEHDYRHDILERIKKLEQEGQEQIEERSKNILSTVIQRFAGSHAAETTTTTLQLPSDDMKGRIIGREGRNIKTIEKLTGAEIIVDETPETIVISGFSPIRRHLAKRALETLIADGRIHPARIEEAIEKAKKSLAKDVKEAGEEAAYDTGVVGLDSKLIQLLGRLKYRTSYGQSVLQHSMEVAHLSGMLAEELSAKTSVCKKGGLLHDIGKAIDHEVQGSHPQLGYEIMKKYGLPEEVAYMAIAHHEDSPHTLEGIVVKIADAISGARPGARKDSYEQYIQRLDELEKVANSFEGVEKTYAIQAGREIRVFVTPEKIDDYGMKKLAHDIAHRIEEDLKYPGEIKVNVIREKRVVEYAK